MSIFGLIHYQFGGILRDVIKYYVWLHLQMSTLKHLHSSMLFSTISQNRRLGHVKLFIKSYSIYRYCLKYIRRLLKHIWGLMTKLWLQSINNI